MHSSQIRGEKVIATSGTAFAISEPNGNVIPGTTDGFYSSDTRFVSTFNLLVNGKPPEAIGVDRFGYSLVSFYTASGIQTADVSPQLSVVRDRMVAAGLHEDIYVMNHMPEDHALSLEIELEADFADIFEVRRGQFQKPKGVAVDSGHKKRLTLVYDSHNFHREAWFSFSEEPVIRGRNARFEVNLKPNGVWKTCINVLPVSAEAPPHMDCVSTVLSSPFGSRREVRVPLERRASTGPLDSEMPEIDTDDPDLEEIFNRSTSDLKALQMEVLPGKFILAAGLPWFMALFGRDSIISAIQTKLLGQELMVQTAETLAHFQAQTTDDFREAQPGKIPHEVRYGELSMGEKLPHSRYYGSIDATPLFLILISETYRWTGRVEFVRQLLPAIDMAIGWIDGKGDMDGDGFIEYRRRTKDGLRNQGWKDSEDSVSFADGRLADPPIALVEVQGYVYDAKRRTAELYRLVGDEDKADRLEREAQELKQKFNKAFWMADKGFFAIALDAEKRQVDSVTSNPGHCLWSQIIDRPKAAVVVKRLLEEDMFSGWGIRTLSAQMARYNPLSYHNGSIWPHDTSIIASGMARYDFFEEASQVALALLDAAVAFPDKRLPELFAGYLRRERSSPIPYPAANAPQAWASGTVIYSLETLLGVTPIDNHLLLEARLKGPDISLKGVPYRHSKRII